MCMKAVGMTIYNCSWVLSSPLLTFRWAASPQLPVSFTSALCLSLPSPRELQKEDSLCVCVLTCVYRFSSNAEFCQVHDWIRHNCWRNSKGTKWHGVPRATNSVHDDLIHFMTKKASLSRCNYNEWTNFPLITKEEIMFGNRPEQ